MKVLLVSQFFPPETAAGANRAGAMAGALAEAFDLRVATVAPSYPDPGLFARQDWQSADRSVGFPITRQPAFRPHGASLARRAMREMAMSAALGWASRAGHAELIVVSTPSMFLAPVCWLRARLSGARWVWDVRDLTWRYAKESAPTGGTQRWLADGLERVMLWLLRRADLVIAATPGLAQVLLEQGVPGAKMITIANGVSRSFLDRFSEATPIAPSARPRVTYVGLMGYNHGIGILLEVARLLPQVDVVLVGDGPERPAIEQRISSERLTNVIRSEYVTDPDQLERLYRSSDVLVNHTKGTPTLNAIVNPAKMFEYFATRRPVVYAGAGLAADFLTGRDLALVVPPDDPVAFADGIRAVLENPRVAFERAERARRVVETEFCRDQQMGVLIAEMRRRFGAAGAAASRGQ